MALSLEENQESRGSQPGLQVSGGQTRLTGQDSREFPSDGNRAGHAGQGTRGHGDQVHGLAVSVTLDNSLAVSSWEQGELSQKRGSPTYR